MLGSPLLTITGCVLSVLDAVQIRSESGVPRDRRPVRGASCEPFDAYQRECGRGPRDAPQTTLLLQQGQKPRDTAALLLHLLRLVSRK
jgi:hypothetical protein